MCVSGIKLFLNYLKFMCVNFRSLTSNNQKANLPQKYKEGIKWETMQSATAVSLMVMIMV